MTAGALDARPRLRPDLTIVRREVRGNVQFIVKEPREGKYSQFGEAEMALMRAMDGTRTPREVAGVAAEALGFTVDPGRVADFAQRLKRMGLVERTPAEDHLMLMERLRGERKVRARRAKGSILRIRWSAGDPDRLFDRWVDRLAWMWTPGFVVASIVCFLLYAAVVVVRWDEIAHGAAALYTASGVTLWDYLLMYAIVLAIIGIHELGHGLTTKRFGGHVHEIGAMLLYFSPALFCNTNDAWLFERRSHRLWVTFAGPWIQLLIVAIAAVAWLFMEPGTFLYHATFLAVLGGGLTNVVTNLNPLIPLDGYYALSDWLEIPNLRKRSFGYWASLLKRHLLRVDAAEPAVTPRERRIFLVYGSLAFAYSVFFAAVSLVWLTLIVGGWLGPWMWPLLAFFAGRAAWRHRGRVSALASAAAISSRAGFVRGRTLATALGGAAFVMALPFLLPWTFCAGGDVQVDAAPRTRVNAPVAGILDSLHVSEGDTVREGQVLARLWSSELRERTIAARARAARLAAREVREEAAGERGAAAAMRAELVRARAELALVEDRLARTVVRAPRAGVVTGHRLRERVGEWATDGTPLLEIAPSGRRTARVRVPLRRAGELAVGQPAHLKFSAWPGVVFVSRVSAVAPAASDGWVEVAVPLAGDSRLPAPGATGRAKIVTGRGTVAQAIGRGVRHLIRLDLWI